MRLEDIKAKYKKMGLVTFLQVDEPNKTYEPHRHDAVRIYTLKGSAKVKLDNQGWQAFGSGEELVINNNQLHEAIVGPEGWEYIFATSAEEAKRQGLL
jgi:quercetin dioxygenase-like cupin family protein